MVIMSMVKLGKIQKPTINKTEHCGKMDAMTKIVTATVLVLEIIICALSVLTINPVNQGILTAKTGYVVSKDLIAGSSSTIYSINILP